MSASPGSSALEPAQPDPAADAGELHLGLYRQMVLIRRFEDAVHDLFLKGEVYGSTHLCSGQEAVSVGVCSMLGEHDRVAATYRGHGHCLALGVDPRGLLAELLGRSTGTCAGRAGSMNVVDLEHSLIGCFGIVGGSIAAATGGAMALRGRGVAVAFFGDGAVNQGYFAECLNFAKVNLLPVVYVCENNGYGEFTPWETVTAGTISGRAEAMGIPTEAADGMDLWAMREAAGRALEHARSGAGPAFIEALTYRYGDHGRGDPVKYRSEEEVASWRARDPLLTAPSRLVDSYGIDSARIEAIEPEVDGELRLLRETVLADPFPQPEPRPAQFKDDLAASR